jgi:hypothetical protein
MRRVNLTDENGLKTSSWFDADSATYFKEETYHDGRNWISKATGSQWNHECLIITAKKRFILSQFSDYQGSKDVREIISKEQAVEWLIRNEYYDECEEAYADLLAQYEV